MKPFAHILFSKDRIHSASHVGLVYSLCLFGLFLPLSRAGASISYGLALGFFIVNKLSSRSITWQIFIPKLPINGPFLYFLIFCSFAILWGQDISTGIHGFSKYLRGFLLVYLVLGAIESKRETNLLVTFLLLGGIFITLNGYVQWFFGKDLIYGYPFNIRMTSNFKAATDFSCYLLFMLPLPLILYKNAVSSLLRKSYITSFVLILIAFIMGFTRSVLFFSICVSLGILFWQTQLSTKYKFLLLLFAFIVIPFLKLPRTHSIYEMVTQATKSVSILERLYIWDLSYKMWRDKPLLGHGINHYSKINVPYFPAKPEEMPYSAAYLHRSYPHNSYLKMTIELGLFGLILYLIIYFHLFRMLIQSIKHTDPKRKFTYLMYFIVITTFALVCLFDTFLAHGQLRPVFWLTVGLVLLEVKPTNAHQSLT